VSSCFISVVDDDDSVRAATGRLLRSFGYNVCLFDSAEAFLASEHRAGAACVVCDVQMPRMNGIDLLEHLQKAGSAPAFIFVTAFPAEQVRRGAMDRGAAGFLSKPFDGRELIALVKGALGHSAG
jgi:FixJ family two-component response regulator